MDAEVLAFPGQQALVPVEQAIGPKDWFVRLSTGALAVWCQAGKPIVQEAPVAPAEGPIHPPHPAMWYVKTEELAPQRDRISMALDLCGMEGPEVDEALGVLNADGTDTVVDAWETGELEPSEEDVRRLATLTGYPVAWFYTPPIPVEGHTFVCEDAGGPPLP